MLELKNLKAIEITVDESKFDVTFKEKNIQFFKVFDEAICENSDIPVYYAESDGSEYFDLIAVEKEGIFNCIPVPIFLESVGVKIDTGSYRDIQSELPFEVINRDDLDEMIRLNKIGKETDEFLDRIDKQSEICDIIKNLTNGKVLTLSTIENQYGGEIADEELYINEDGLFEKSYINCYNSSTLNLGTCQCNSHPASMEEVISPKEAMQLIEDYLVEISKEEEEKEKQRQQIAQILQLCY